MKKALVIGSGDFKCPEDVNERIIIACDGGLEYCREFNLSPDYILGDFDSVTPQTLEFYSDRDKTTYPTKKDMTDIELGLRLAIDIGAEDITITGAVSGSRFDHSICNIQLLCICIEKGITARIINKTNTIILLGGGSGKKLTLKNENTYISLLPLTKTVKGITVTGFEYPLDNYDLFMGSSLCVSNRIIDDYGCISVDEGILIVISALDEV